tara:strand:- start:430 stop:606 length:177 start_codon:yes stop_codon:yes gene_type:complete
MTYEEFEERYQARLEELKEELEPTVVEKNGSTINLTFRNLKTYEFKNENMDIRFTQRY